eukprot:COSAG02_NODE_193_length_29843_cov_30.519903_37_plen_114_part_00
MCWPRRGPFGQFGGWWVVRGWSAGGEGLSRASSWLEIYDVTVELGETGAPRRVPGASSWSARQVGRPEQHPAMCGVELAGPIGVLDTANSMRFARRAQLHNRLGCKITRMDSY